VSFKEQPKFPHTSSASEQVRAFYERLPYPAPLTSLDEHRDLYQNADRRRVRFHLMFPTEPLRKEQRILIAGCGTSQAARYALREPDAQITAIDISEMSLRYTRDLQRKYDLQNLDIHQLAIEDARDLGRTFDQVVCTGVLHHLVDPNRGLRTLRDVLNPRGAMNLMVYAPYGRAGIYLMQKYCRLLGITASDTDLQQLTQTLRALPPNHPIAHSMQVATDFDHPETVADVLLHPLDRAYSVPELYDWLERCGMSFGRWVEQAPYLPHCGMLAKSPDAHRLTSLPPPLQHAAVELFRGVMARHKLIAYRDDRRGASQPINFEDNRWREYVPIRVPWTVCVRERLPAGSVAVLINRAHPFTDLVLPINRTEEPLLNAINGKRTLNEILVATGTGLNERWATEFFERLWQYDQIIVDASQLNP